MNGAGGAGGVGDASIQQKRAAEASEQERVAKQMRTATNMAHGNAMAASQAVFGSPQQQSLFYMGSQPMMPQSLQLPVQQSMMPVASSVPVTQAQHVQMQLQQRQQQQQYAAAMAARQNTQQQQQQMAVMMMGQRSAATSMTPGVGQTALGNQGAYSSGESAPPQQTPALIGTQNHLQPVRAETLPTTSVAQTAPATTNEEPCVVCGKKGDIFTCNGGCGLHAHPACIGEDAIFPFVVGQLCGSCFIVQQNRASPEDLTKGGPHALSVRRAILCVNLETNSTANFDKFGHLASLRLGEIGSRWIREKLATADKWM
eukprot:jgi/Phyca11/535265/estExt2_fgenesh1_pg.C_PHYCAscaffold_330096